MNVIEKLKQVNQNIWFILIFIFAALFYLFNINFSDIWIDEAFTKALTKHSFGEIIGLVQNDFHPPLYFIAVKMFVALAGLSDFTLRLFSVLGLLATLLLVYLAGQKIFGKSGALYFCLLIISLPMLAEYAHEARMYTWGTFAVAGTFIFTARFMDSAKRSDLIWCMLFSVIAAYTHYYALLAAFWANVFLSVFLFMKRKDQFKTHLVYSVLAVVLYLPWLVVVMGQAKKVAQTFWVPALDWQFFISCLLSPFAPKIYLPPFLPLAVFVYGLMLWVLYRNYIAGKKDHRLVLGLSICMFWCTILTAVIISWVIQPVFYMRYLSNIIILILVPVTLFFIDTKSKWIKGVALIAILIMGIKISIDGSSFSFGPYKQSLSYIHEKYPDVKKIIHVSELTAGPFAELNNYGFQNYLFNPESTIVYTNMDAFKNIIQTGSPGKVLHKEESFCLACFPFLSLNENNMKRIFSESQLTKIDTVYDSKVDQGIALYLYMMKFKGESGGN